MSVVEIIIAAAYGVSIIAATLAVLIGVWWDDDH